MADYQDLSGQATYNHGPLGGVAGFIFHHTGGRGTPQGVINTLNQRGLGVQYVMDRDGTIYRTLPAGARGAHIQDSPDGRLSNANTEGMEVIANDDRDITPAQVASARQFATDYSQQHPGIQFFGHGQVNPGHKEATEGQTIVQAIGGGTGATTATTTPTGPDTRQLVFNALVKEGLTPQQALGSLWSMGGESHSTLDTNAYNPKDPGGAIGIAQWLGSRRKDLEAYAAAQNKPVNDPNVQVGFLTQELRGSENNAFKLLQQAKTPEEAARIWTKYYERPQVDNSEARIAAGKRVGSLDAQGNFVVGDRAPTTTPRSAPSAGTPATTTPAGDTGTVSPSSNYPGTQTPAQMESASIGQQLAGLANAFSPGSGSSGGGNSSAEADQPRPNIPALDAVQNRTPDARPPTSTGLGPQLGAMAMGASGPVDPMTGAPGPPGASITQGAPSMAQLLDPIGTSADFNMFDQRSVRPPATVFKGIRFA